MTKWHKTNRILVISVHDEHTCRVFDVYEKNQDPPRSRDGSAHRVPSTVSSSVGSGASIVGGSGQNMVALSLRELSGELGQLFILNFFERERGYCQYKPPGKLFHNLKMFLYFCSKHLKTVALSLFLLQGAFPAYRTRDTRSRVRPGWEEKTLGISKFSAFK